jgi:hypothetical protein
MRLEDMSSSKAGDDDILSNAVPGSKPFSLYIGYAVIN